MHVGFAINVIQTAKYRKCIYEIVRVLYGKTIDVILTAENQMASRMITSKTSSSFILLLFMTS